MSLVPSEVLATSTAPFADAARALLGDWGGRFVAIGAAISCFGALNGWVLVAGQLPMAAAHDGLFPPLFGRLSARGTPALGMVLAGTLSSVLVAMNYSRGLVELFTFIILLSTLSTLVPYVFCSLAVWLMPGQPRPAGAAAVVSILAFVYAMFAIGGAGAETVYYGFLLAARRAAALHLAQAAAQGDRVSAFNEFGPPAPGRDAAGRRGVRRAASDRARVARAQLHGGARLRSAAIAQHDALHERCSPVSAPRSSALPHRRRPHPRQHLRARRRRRHAARRRAGPHGQGRPRASEPAAQRPALRGARLCRGRRHRARPACSKAATSSGSTAGPWPSAAATAPTTTASGSCAICSGPDVEVVVVPLPHYRGPGDVFHLMSIVSPVDRDLAVVHSPLMPVPFREWLLRPRLRASSRYRSRSSIRWAATCWPSRRAAA